MGRGKEGGGREEERGEGGEVERGRKGCGERERETRAGRWGEGGGRRAGTKTKRGGRRAGRGERGLKRSNRIREEEAKGEELEE